MSVCLRLLSCVIVTYDSNMPTITENYKRSYLYKCFSTSSTQNMTQSSAFYIFDFCFVKKKQRDIFQFIYCNGRFICSFRIQHSVPVISSFLAIFLQKCYFRHTLFTENAEPLGTNHKFANWFFFKLHQMNSMSGWFYLRNRT